MVDAIFQSNVTLRSNEGRFDTEFFKSNFKLLILSVRAKQF
jgi:hypothetical protein